MTSTIDTPTSLFEELLAPGSLGGYLNGLGFRVEDATATYTRYKPGAGAVIAADLTCGGESHLAYLRRTRDPGRAAEIVAKAYTMKPRDTTLGPSVRLLDERTVLFLFPTDAKLRQLRWVASGDRLRYLVGDIFDDGPYCGERSKITILRYKPERRLVGRAELVPKRNHPNRSFVYRLTAQPEAAKLTRINQAAREAGIATPAPIATLEEGHFHLEEALDAVPLVEAAGERVIDPAALVDTLARIGSVQCPTLELTTPADDLARCLQALRATLTYQPQLDTMAESLERYVIASCPEPGPAVTSHGDLHLHQFMMDDDTTYLVDWERAAVGHPARDIGRLLAHPHALGIRRPELPIAALTSLVSEAVEGFRRRRTLLDADLGFYLAVAFVDQALLVSRHLEPDSGARSRSLLELALSAVEGARPALAGGALS